MASSSVVSLIRMGTAVGAWAVLGTAGYKYVQRTPAAHADGDWYANWDGRDPTAVRDDFRASRLLGTLFRSPTHAAHRDRHVVLIRHGIYNDYGRSNDERALTETGVQQARLCGQRLVELNPGRFLYNIVSSSSNRAVQTAQAVTQQIADKQPESLPTSNKLSRNKLGYLKEGFPIKPEPPGNNVWWIKDGVRLEDAFRRTFHRADRLTRSSDQLDVYVCHGNVIRYFLCRALQLPPEAWLRFGHHHTGISWFTIDRQGRVTVKLFADSGHLPVDIDTYLNPSQE